MNDIRPLRESDKDDVLEIARHIWEGHDYIPYFFDAWLKDTDSHPVGIEYSGHIVALANLRVIDNGRTGWMEALRVHPNHRGEGLATTLTQYVVRLAKNIPVSRIRYTTAVGNETSLHLAKTVGMKRKFNLAVHWQENPTEITWRSSGLPLLEITAHDISRDLIDAKLLPFNIIVYDWKALDATSDGLAKVGSIARFWVQKEAGKIRSLSLGYIRDGISGAEWGFTIYAKDAAGFLNHLSHHVNMASEASCTSIFGAFDTRYLDTLYSLDWVKLDEEEDEEMALTLLERVL
jgi:GNAT superfamily N-acetyltransferase